MVTVVDGIMVARLIMDIIAMYQKAGVNVDLESLAESIENEKARMERVAKQLGL